MKNENVHSFVIYYVLLCNASEEVFAYRSQNQQIHVSVGTRVIKVVYLLQVSITHVAILKEVRYSGWIYRDSSPPAASTNPYFVTHLPEKSFEGILCVYFHTLNLLNLFFKFSILLSYMNILYIFINQSNTTI
jgi:hypothetical protein